MLFTVLFDCLVGVGTDGGLLVVVEEGLAGDSEDVVFAEVGATVLALVDFTAESLAT